MEVPHTEIFLQEEKDPLTHNHQQNSTFVDWTVLIWWTPCWEHEIFSLDKLEKDLIHWCRFWRDHLQLRMAETSNIKLVWDNFTEQGNPRFICLWICWPDSWWNSHWFTRREKNTFCIKRSRHKTWSVEKIFFHICLWDVKYVQQIYDNSGFDIAPINGFHTQQLNIYFWKLCWIGVSGVILEYISNILDEFLFLFFMNWTLCSKVYDTEIVLTCSWQHCCECKITHMHCLLQMCCSLPLTMRVKCLHELQWRELWIAVKTELVSVDCTGCCHCCFWPDFRYRLILYSSWAL